MTANCTANDKEIGQEELLTACKAYGTYQAPPGFGEDSERRTHLQCLRARSHLYLPADELLHRNGNCDVHQLR